jgi:hypothetical protein
VHTFFKYDEDTPLHCKGVVSCFSGKHFEIETTKDTRSTKRIGKRRGSHGRNSILRVVRALRGFKLLVAAGGRIAQGARAVIRHEERTSVTIQ